MFMEVTMLMMLAAKVWLFFFPKTALKIKHKLLHNASVKLKTDHQVGEIQ